MKKWVGKGTVPERKLPIPETKLKSQSEPAQILDRRSQVSRRKTREEVLLRWEGQPKEDVVWVKEDVVWVEESLTWRAEIMKLLQLTTGKGVT